MHLIQSTHSPIDGSLYLERPYASTSEISEAVSLAKAAQKVWRKVPLGERVELCRQFADVLLDQKDQLGLEITMQMGRPIRYTPNEIVGMAGRVVAMCDMAEDALADIQLAAKDGFHRFIRREPLGVVFAIAPWNYPYLTAVNTVIPALIAGNTVILKHSPQTPLVAERFAEAFEQVGLPKGVFQYLHLTDSDAQSLVGNDEIDFVAFTGSVATGLKVQGAASTAVKGIGLELGGKDPAYVRSDADLAFAVENVLDGALFSSGQSCCAVERVYVHADLYDAFVDGVVALARTYVLANPLDTATSLGPMVRTQSADFVRAQISEAVSQGAKSLIAEEEFYLSKPGTPYLAPQILVDVNHAMRVMSEESFGPVVGIMKVHSDEEAISLMNDREFGLTASIWTKDEQAALAIADQLESGTVFMNRCDYLDPELAWVGVKNSGKGCTLSRVGYEHLTRPKSYHFRVKH
jgi:acyl-CoA reductase-like NAD-dependent aldehyde dehydrogenase